MLEFRLDPYLLTIREPVGLAHERQVVEIPIPAGSTGLFHLRDERTGRLFPAQASQRTPGRGYLLLAIKPGETLALAPDNAPVTSAIDHAVSTQENAGAWTIGNGRYALELSNGQRIFSPDQGAPVSGPIQRIRRGDGLWRGRTFFDTSAPAVREQAKWLETGPLRTTYQYRIEFARGGFYELELTADAGLEFVRLHEKFRGGAADQIVWDFAGADLPERISLLDSTAAYTRRWLHYHLDQRHARLWCWNQFSQLHDLSDGFALHFTGSNDVVGLVSLEGGKWHGNALNHLEAWSRRWRTYDPATRRLPADTKADSFPGIDVIPARGHSVNAPHFTLEGWLRQGERRFALVLSTAEKIAPPIETEGAKGERGCSVALGHFERVPRRNVYRQTQARLRQIHIQHGVFPLQDQLGLAFAWPLEESFTAGADMGEARRHALEIAKLHHGPGPADDPDEIKLIDDFLAARVYGFWEGSGAAYSNVVVSRRVGPDMLRFEALVQQGKLNAGQVTRWRAWFSFMAHLYFSDNFYPGPSSMEPVDSNNSFEPTIAGMANQNFYTDAIALFGVAGQVFTGNPSAGDWRDKFLVNWHRQLEYHLYPESGVWEESHTYYGHVLHTVLPLLLRRKADGTRDDFADARLQKLVGGAILQLTPRDATFGGVRHLVPFGDHHVAAGALPYLYREMALGFAPHAPELAANLAWYTHETCRCEVPGVAEKMPKLATGYVQGVGFFFRANVGTPQESLLALRSGMSWGHHHTDDGSIQFYARGHALVVDAAFSHSQERGERKFLAPGHSRPVPENHEPLTHLWRFNRGWIVDSRVSPTLAYAVAGLPLIAAWPPNLPVAPYVRAVWGLRAIVQLTPDVYLVADHFDATDRQLVRFHIPEQQVVVEGSRVAARFASDCLLNIAPLVEVAPPHLSFDRPSNAAHIPREVTTAVEYVAPGKWSVFVMAALGQGERLDLSSAPDATKVTVGTQAFEVRFAGETLEVAAPSDSGRVLVEPGKLLGALRAGSR
jgi:hypothetical protein